jgi:hypothetical protein
VAYSVPSCLDRTYLKVFLVWPGSNKVKWRFSSFGAAGECANLAYMLSPILYKMHVSLQARPNRKTLICNDQ